MKKYLFALLFMAVLGYSGAANAGLITIGTAQFGGTGDHYNLIWQDDNNGNSLVWLDYSNEALNWNAQKNWAAGLDLTYNWFSDYSVSWFDESWRLPSTVDEAYSECDAGYDGTTPAGYNITTSEMGHLYYVELGNKGYYATNGTYPQTGWGLNNTGNFDNLISEKYWSGTEYTGDYYDAWLFSMEYGNQYARYQSHSYYGLAVRNAQVSVVPEPGTFLLFGIGLAGLGLWLRKLRS